MYVTEYIVLHQKKNDKIQRNNTFKVEMKGYWEMKNRDFWEFEMHTYIFIAMVYTK